MWFDLSPMRPGEYWASDAEQLTEAIALRNAIEEAKRAVSDEIAAERINNIDNEVE